VVHSGEQWLCIKESRDYENKDYKTQRYLPQVEQLVAEQVPQEELAVLLNFPPLEKANADIIRFTFLLLHLGQVIFSEVLKTNFSNSCSHWLQ
jgi:hypothetical protein